MLCSTVLINVCMKYNNQTISSPIYDVINAMAGLQWIPEAMVNYVYD